MCIIARCLYYRKTWQHHDTRGDIQYSRFSIYTIVNTLYRLYIQHIGIFLSIKKKRIYLNYHTVYIIIVLCSSNSLSSFDLVQALQLKLIIVVSTLSLLSCIYESKNCSYIKYINRTINLYLRYLNIYSCKDERAGTGHSRYPQWCRRRCAS